MCAAWARGLSLLHLPRRKAAARIEALPRMGEAFGEMWLDTALVVPSLLNPSRKMRHFARESGLPTAEGLPKRRQVAALQRLRIFNAPLTECALLRGSLM